MSEVIADTIFAASGDNFRTNLDALMNVMTGMGTCRDKTIWTDIGLNVKLSARQLEELFQHEFLVQKVVTTIPEEATREWVKYSLGGDSEPRELTEFVQYQDRLVNESDDEIGLQDAIEEALFDEALYGGSLIVIHADDGREPWEPLNLDAIKTIRYLQEFNRHQVAPVIISEYLPHPNVRSCWYGDRSRPTHYNLIQWNPDAVNGHSFTTENVNAVAGSGAYGLVAQSIRNFPDRYSLIHSSRVLRFGGVVRLPYATRQRNQGWGDSLIQRFWEPFKMYAVAVQTVSAMIYDADVVTHYVKGLWEILASNEGDTIKAFKCKIEESDKIRSTYRREVLDTENEKIEIVTRDIKNIVEGLEALQTYMVSASNLPHTVLLGNSPKGKLGESGKSEQLDFGRTVRRYQSKQLRKQLNRFFRLQWLAKDSPTKGDYPDAFSWEFNDPYPLNQADVAILTEKYAGSYAKYIERGVLFPEEVAESLYGQAEPSFQIILDRERRERETPSAALHEALSRVELEEKPLHEDDGEGELSDLTQEANF